MLAQRDSVSAKTFRSPIAIRPRQPRSGLPGRSRRGSEPDHLWRHRPLPLPHLETQAGATPLDGYKSAAHGHSDYGRDALRRMTGYNLATILLGKPDLAVRETLPQR
ncbi:hypothetical protein I553_10528 [Mycobacterium xenopi 4042]|uniref:Uncharacterized protein n=1 Tax=Mycobacterium xenopi 4042 TaxID=1299334 RepID=X8DKY5_MYCXE|nr:hypothetical protein I553_10528 [Mycobacterium xenopi 4042]